MFKLALHLFGATFFLFFFFKKKKEEKNIRHTANTIMIYWFTAILMYLYTAMLFYKKKNIRLYRYTDVLVTWYTIILVYGYTDIAIDGYTGLLIYCYTDIPICRQPVYRYISIAVYLTLGSNGNAGATVVMRRRGARFRFAECPRSFICQRSGNSSNA